MMTWNQWSFQDSVSPVMEEFLFFNDFAMIILSFITTFVLYIMVSVVFNKFIGLELLDGQVIECVWTLVPAIILIQIAIPSLTLLYMLDELADTQISLKVIGHQWYWSYELGGEWSNGPFLEFDSYMEQELEGDGLMRLLDVDNRITLPFNVHVRVLLSSADVLHSWAIPSLGVKADASPGRLNQLKFMSFRPGVYFGQCSEICGANHSFMPISVEFISLKDYFWWLSMK